MRGKNKTSSFTYSWHPHKWIAALMASAHNKHLFIKFFSANRVMDITLKITSLFSENEATVCVCVLCAYTSTCKRVSTQIDVCVLCLRDIARSSLTSIYSCTLLHTIQLTLTAQGPVCQLRFVHWTHGQNSCPRVLARSPDLQRDPWEFTLTQIQSFTQPVWKGCSRYLRTLAKSAATVGQPCALALVWRGWI